ncbi:MAG: divalent metal cation transporter [Pirellulaceae bacterium]
MDRLLAFLRRLGPGLISVCVVIGPGSLLTSLRVGATHGYSLLWVLVVAVAFMMFFMTLGARLGVLGEGTPGDIVRRKLGPIWVAAIGIGVFLIASIFQSGNNLGVLGAVEAWQGADTAVGDAATSDAAIDPTWGVLTLLVVNGLAIAFLVFGTHFYRNLERVMAVFVGIMLLAFAANLFFAPPDPFAMVRGLVPFATSDGEFDGLTVIGWIATTCIPAVAWFQGYLAKQKGWTRADLAAGLWDARLGAMLLGVITLIITITAAEALNGADIGKAKLQEIAGLLDGAFGDWGRRLFAAGLFSAAYSSYLVNASVGGFLLADGLGMDPRPERWAPRLFSILVLVLGMLPALVAGLVRGDILNLVVFAQALTVLISPLIVITLLLLTSRRDVMGDGVNGWPSKIVGAIGATLMIIAALVVLVTKVVPPVRGLFASPASAAESRTPLSTQVFELPLEETPCDELPARILAWLPVPADLARTLRSDDITVTKSRTLVVDQSGGWWLADGSVRQPASTDETQANLTWRRLIGIEFAARHATWSTEARAWLAVDTDGSVAWVSADGGIHEQTPPRVRVDRWLGQTSRGDWIGTSRWGRCLVIGQAADRATRVPAIDDANRPAQADEAQFASEPPELAWRYVDLELAPGAAVLDGRWLWLADAFDDKIALVDCQDWNIVAQGRQANGTVGAMCLDRERDCIWGVSTKVSGDVATELSAMQAGDVVTHRLWRLDRTAANESESAWLPTQGFEVRGGADPVDFSCLVKHAPLFGVEVEA